jgi:amidase
MENDNLSRRDFLAASAVGLTLSHGGIPQHHEPSSGAVRQQTPAFELDEATISSLQDGMQSGRYTSRRITQLYLNRIDQIDRRGPSLRSVIETNPDALTIADQLDAERKSGAARGAAATGARSWPTPATSRSSSGS